MTDDMDEQRDVRDPDRPVDDVRSRGRHTGHRRPRPNGEPEAIWRRDFPFTSEGEETVTRREFTRYLALASGAFAAGNVAIAGWASAREEPEGQEVRVVALDEVPVGGTYLFRYPHHDEPAILVRTAEDDVVGWSQKCTHLGCVIYYEHEEDVLECPCHEGFFDVRSGQVLAGPPERPLPRIALEIRDGDIWAVGYDARGDRERGR